MIKMDNKSYIDKHPNITSVVGVVLWFAVLALMSVLGGCKSHEPVYVEVAKYDTLYVWRADTICEVHNDTIREKVVVTVRDSIIKETIVTNIVNEAGSVIHTEKETNQEVWHESDTNNSLVQHTVDSLLKVKMDSVYNSKVDDSVVVMEAKKSFWEKTCEAVRKPFLFIGVVVVIVGCCVVLWKLFLQRVVK